MSTKVFEKVEFEDIFEVSDPFIETVINYAIPHAVNHITSYWGRKEAEGIISDATFGFVWTNYPKTRRDMLELAMSVAHRSTRVKSLTKVFCDQFLSDLYNLIEDNDDLEDASLKIKLAPIADPSFDYLSQLCKYSLDPEKERLFDLWKAAGLNASSDDAFYEYLWGKVKREKGATDEKLNILKASSRNHALSDVILTKIAKSSPKRLKRSASSVVSQKIIGLRHSLAREKRQNNTTLANHLQKMVDATESKAMLFVDCTDAEVVSNLLECLSKDNLPWLMPSASNHSWLARRLQDRIEESND